jgi:hypothetical protein
MKKIIFALALVAAMCVCSATSISAGEDGFHFQTISFPDDTFAQLLGINDSDMIAGYHGATVNKGFVFTWNQQPGLYRRLLYRYRRDYPRLPGYQRHFYDCGFPRHNVQPASRPE